MEWLRRGWVDRAGMGGKRCRGIRGRNEVRRHRVRIWVGWGVDNEEVGWVVSRGWEGVGRVGVKLRRKPSDRHVARKPSC